MIEPFFSVNGFSSSNMAWFNQKELAVDKRYLKGIKLVRGIRMLLPTTEKLPDGDAIDALPAASAAAMMLAGQQAALNSARPALPRIVQGATLKAPTLRNSGRLIYAAAGSSGLMALADACELPGDTEDDTLAADTVTAPITPNDSVIVLSASGTTPYALAIAVAAQAKGANVIAIANNPGSALLDHADVAICLETQSELIAGSTRMGAATAQKATLNLMSSLMGIKLGHVYRGEMVNLIADNAKLQRRAVRIIAKIADTSETVARAALATMGGDTKAAIYWPQAALRQQPQTC